MTQQQLLDDLGFIAMHKDMLPFRLRGWVNALGLYVRERKAGQWTRVQAGGKFRSYLDAWCENGGQWNIKRFDSDTWDRRFSQLVEPTSQIAEFLVDAVEADETLNAEHAGMLALVVRRYEAKGEWVGLPFYGDWVSQEATTRRWAQRRELKLEKAGRQERLQRISEYEERIRVDPEAPTTSLVWRVLAGEYEAEGRFKEMENALLKSIGPETTNGPLDMFDRNSHMYLGKAYLAAVSNAVRGRGLPIWGSSPSAVNAESLGYTIETLQALAVQNLSKVELTSDESLSEEMKLAVSAAHAPSDQTFEEYNHWIVKQNAAQA